MDNSSQTIPALPKGLEIQDHFPHKRAVWSRDETCFSPSGIWFASAFNITEVTMMNEMANIVWGKVMNGKPIIEGKLLNLPVFCWGSPFAHWLSETCFAVKAAKAGKTFPVIAIDTAKGIQLVPGLDTLESRAKHATPDMLMDEWQEYTPDFKL